MKYFKKIVAHISWRLSKIIPKNKHYIIYYTKDFLNCKYFKRINLSKKIWCLFKGFLPKEYFAYDLPQNDYKNYLPALKNYSKTSLNGKYNSLLINKLQFEKHIKPIINGINYLHVIESIAYIENGYLHSLNNTIVPGNYVSLISFLQKNDLILKPISGSKGKGIILLQKIDDYFLFENRKLSWKELIPYFKNLNHYLIQERFKQQGFSHDIYTESLNTLRIATMIDPVTKQSFIPYAVHRFGSLKSGHKDNFSQGGISAMIDITHGKLSMGLSLSSKGQIEFHKSHPLSHQPIHNQQIPNWNNFTKSLIDMANKMPYFKYVGWDIILSNEDIHILEGNNCPDLDLIQIHKPISEIKSAQNFFQHYKFFD